MKKTLPIIAVLTAIFLLYFLAPDQELTIDNSKTIDQLIAKGGYSAVHINPTNYSSSKKSGVEYLKMKLFDSVLPLSFLPQDVLKEMAEDGYRPAYFNELLTYKLLNPKPEKSIVALGSVYIDPADYENCPYISYTAGKNNQLTYELKEVGIHSISYVDESPFAFLAIKK